MSKRKDNTNLLFFILLIDIILFISAQEYASLYSLPIEILGPEYLPVIPIYLKDYSLFPKYMLIDINIDKSWIFDYSSDNNQNNKEIINNDIYSVQGYKNIEKIYLNSALKIEDFCYFNIKQVKNQNNYQNYYPGVLSLNKNLNEYNIITKFKYDDSTNLNSKYLGFCLDFTNRDNKEGELSIGNMQDLNENILELIRLPLYVEEEENKNKENKQYSKWSIKLNGLFIGSINNSNLNNNENKEKKITYNIDRKINKGLIIDESANIETKYNSIYVTKEAMLFLSAHYFNDKEKVCFREENTDENNYEIKYNCFKSKKEKLKNINLIFENNVTMQLTHDDLLNCAINQNLNLEKDEQLELCEFNIKYNQNIDHYSLGLSAFRKFKTYFMFNDNSILLEGDKFLNCYLDNEKFSNISRKKRSLGETIKELFSTTLCISFIFALLYGIFHLYEKLYLKKDYRNEKIINRDKYANL